LAKFFAEIPFAYIEARSDVLFSIALVYLSLFLVLKIKSKGMMKRIAFAVLIVANIYVYFFSDGIFFERKSFKSFEVTVLDVGQGDAIFVQFPDGKNILIDGGNKTFNFDPGQRVIEPFLRKKGVNKINAVLVTHPHNDHIGGIPYILENFEVGAVIDNGLNYGSEIYRRYLDVINRKGIRHIVVRAGNKIELSKDARIYVLHPTEPFVKGDNDEDRYGAGHKVNNSSVVIKIQYGGNSFLFMGDAEKEAEDSMMKIYDTFLKSDWVKVGHHGSETSSSSGFVLKVKPTWAVISVGKYNKYNHPSDIVLRRYNLIGSRIHRTDEEGAGVFRSDGKNIEKVQWRD
jgi:competence protein ComEC